MIKRILKIALLFTISVMAFSQSHANKIENILEQYLAFNQFNGSVLVAEKGEIIHKRGYGFANFEWEIKNTTDTKFRLASITKQFTAMLIMLEVQDGNIDLDLPISTYIPDYPNSTAAKVTIHHLLTHTSGIPSYTSFPGFFAEKSRDFYSPQKLMELFWEMDLEFEMGSQFNYSNSGYHLLGVILEKVSGKSYDTLLTERIFKPLGMSQSGYDWNKPIIKNRAGAYQKAGNKIMNANHIDMSIPYSAGSIFSTVEDLYKWDRSLYTFALLSEPLTKKMFTPYHSGYAYGWNISKEKHKNGTDYMMISHNGGVNGFATLIRRFVTDDHLIVLLDNTSGGKNNEIAANIFNILNDLPIKDPKQTISQLADKKYGNELLAVLKAHPASEGDINQMGYGLLAEGRFDDAIIVFKFNADQHPRSANTFDSLGDAYNQNGEKQKSIASYKAALAIDPGFPSSVSALNTLGVHVQLKEKATIKVNESILKTYVGKYELQPGFILTVTLKEGQLTTQATGQGPALIFPESNIKFFLKIVDAKIQFNKDKEGNVVSLTLFQGGREIVAKRL